MNAVLAALRDAPHVSISSVKTYLRCPMAYAHRYVLHTEPSHRGVALVVGRATHEAIEVYYQTIAETGEVPVLEMLTDIYTDSWNRDLESGLSVRSKDLDADKVMGLSLVRTFHEEVPRPSKVVAVEQAFALTLVDPESGRTLDRLLVGAIDAFIIDEEGRKVLVESKTAGRRWSRDQLDYDPQVSVYQMAVRELGIADDPVLRFDFLLKLKKPQMESVEVTRPPHLEREALVVIGEVLRAIDAGIHYPVRGWACAGCEYAHACG